MRRIWQTCWYQYCKNRCDLVSFPSPSQASLPKKEGAKAISGPSGYETRCDRKTALANRYSPQSRTDFGHVLAMFVLAMPTNILEIFDSQASESRNTSAGARVRSSDLWAILSGNAFMLFMRWTKLVGSGNIHVLLKTVVLSLIHCYEIRYIEVSYGRMMAL